jgi:hypothetical protein
MTSKVWVPGLLALSVSPSVGRAETPTLFEADTVDAARLAGEDDAYRPFLRTRLFGLRLEAPLSVAARNTVYPAVPVDSVGTELSPEPELDVRARVGLRLDSEDRFGLLVFAAEFEFDAISGPVSGGDDGKTEAIAPPLSDESGQALRKAYGRFSFGPFVTLAGGYTTSHWGLGLVANDGAHGHTPGGGEFSDPRGGDRVLRGQVVTGPWSTERLLVSVAYDVVQDDDVTLSGDEATQVSAAVVVGHQRPNRVGVYVARRAQEARDGDETNVTVYDVHGRLEGKPVGQVKAFLESEAAFISGETDLGPTAEHPRHDVVQLGVATRFGLSQGRIGGVADVVYASGDQNFEDAEQNGFRADPNFEQGLLLYRGVMAAQTARAPVRAADPELVGYPSEDLDRLPSRGQVTNTVTFFPRAVYRPTDGLEIYGGPLFAWAEANLVDARETRLAGGEPHNALGGKPTAFLGTEYDVGLRYTALLGGTRLTLGAEGGYFVPGGAFASGSAAGVKPLDSASGGRVLAQWEL